MKSNCNKCMHKEMCKYRDNVNSEEILAKVQEDYPFIAEIDFSCRYFEKRERAAPAPENKPQKASKKAEMPVMNEPEVPDVPEKEDVPDAPTGTADTFDDIRIADFGLDADVTEELIGLGGEDVRIRDLKGIADKMKPITKTKVNARLQAFNHSL